MKDFWDYIRAVVRGVISTGWVVLSLAGAILGTTLVAVAKKAIKLETSTLVVDAALLMLVLVVGGTFNAWRSTRNELTDSGDKNQDLQQRLETARAPVLIGGAGGPGGSVDGSMGDRGIGGNGGHGGGVAYGEGGYAEGGKGAAPPLSLFERLAHASLGMGYPLDEFIRLAGFGADGDELDQIGRGGDGGDSAGSPGTDGGPGLQIVTFLPDSGAKQVEVFRADGKHFTIRARDTDRGATET